MLQMLSSLDSTNRAASRKRRQEELENEQYQEDLQALRMTAEQRDILLRSFNAVQVEFSDLDGLRWSGPALQNRDQSPSDPYKSQQNSTFSLLTNSDLSTTHQSVHSPGKHRQTRSARTSPYPRRSYENSPYLQGGVFTKQIPSQPERHTFPSMGGAPNGAYWDDGVDESNMITPCPSPRLLA